MPIQYLFVLDDMFVEECVSSVMIKVINFEEKSTSPTQEMTVIADSDVGVKIQMKITKRVWM